MEQLRGALDWLYVDWKSLDWNQIVEMNDFRWNYGKTPFSHFQIPVVIAVSYLISLVVLQSYMKERKPYVLKYPTFFHNVNLTLLSLVMFLGSSYGAFLKYRSQGFKDGLVCEQEAEPMHGPLFYWSYIFYLSKFYELIDTYLLVLKKKPLIFLHVFHHFIMPFVCWAGLEGKWCMALWTSAFWNSFVHVIMYYYYSVSTLGYSPWWKKHLTALQIYQFVSGVAYTGIYFYYYLNDVKFSLNPLTFDFKQGCTGEPWAVLFMFSVNCSFLILFTKFFISQYLSKSKRVKAE